MNNKIKFLFLFISMFCLGISLSNAQESFDSEDDLKKKAAKLFEEEKFAEASPLYSQLVSNYSKDAEFNYRLGVCMLNSLDDKEKAMPFLMFAASKPDVEKEVHFYLGKAYHLNYMFDDAILEYSAYLKTANEKDKKKFDVQRQIEMCVNGKKLLNSLTDLKVMSKKEMSREDFFRAYDVSEIGGRLLVKPNEKTFKTSLDIKRKEQSIIYLSKDKSQLYFASYGEKGENEKDIYIIKKTKDGGWSSPQSLSMVINTKYDEDFPFLHPNGKVLYFSSKGHNSMGGYDIFKSTLNESTKQWGAPVNMDFPINTPDDDILYVTDSSEQQAYFSSARASKTGDISVYHINVERRPLKVVIVSGKVIRNKAEQALNSKITVKDLASNAIVGIHYSSPKDGSYNFEMPNGGSFSFTVESEDFPTQSDVVIVPIQYEFKPMKQKISYDPVSSKMKIESTYGDTSTDENYLFALNYIKNKSKLNVSLVELVPTNKAVGEKKEDVNLVTKEPELNVVPVEKQVLSNQDIVKIAYEDAEDVKKEAKDLRDQADIAMVFADQKNVLAEGKSNEAKEFLDKAKSTNDIEEKETFFDMADDASIEANLLNRETVTAYNLAKKLDKKAFKKQEEADLFEMYASSLDSAVNSENPEEAMALMEEQAKSLDELVKSNGGPASISENLQYEAKANERELNIAIQSVEDAKQDLASNNIMIENLKQGVENESNEELKEGMQNQIVELYNDIAIKSKELKKQENEVLTLKNERNRILHEAEIVNTVIGKSKLESSESLSANLATIDKTRLEKDVNTISENPSLYSEDLESEEMDDELLVSNTSSNSDIPELENGFSESDAENETTGSADTNLENNASANNSKIVDANTDAAELENRSSSNVAQNEPAKSGSSSSESAMTSSTKTTEKESSNSKISDGQASSPIGEDGYKVEGNTENIASDGFAEGENEQEAEKDLALNNSENIDRNEIEMENEAELANDDLLTEAGKSASVNSGEDNDSGSEDEKEGSVKIENKSIAKTEGEEFENSTDGKSENEIVNGDPTKLLPNGASKEIAKSSELGNNEIQEGIVTENVVAVNGQTEAEHKSITSETEPIGKQKSGLGEVSNTSTKAGANTTIAPNSTSSGVKNGQGVDVSSNGSNNSIKEGGNKTTEINDELEEGVTSTLEGVVDINPEVESFEPADQEEKNIAENSQRDKKEDNAIGGLAIENKGKEGNGISVNKENVVTNVDPELIEAEQEQSVQEKQMVNTSVEKAPVLESGTRASNDGLTEKESSIKLVGGKVDNKKEAAAQGKVSASSPSKSLTNSSSIINESKTEVLPDSKSIAQRQEMEERTTNTAKSVSEALVMSAAETNDPAFSNLNEQNLVKLKALDKIESPVDRDLAKADLLRDWSNEIDAYLAKQKDLYNASTDGATMAAMMDQMNTVYVNAKKMRNLSEEHYQSVQESTIANNNGKDQQQVVSVKTNSVIGEKPAEIVNEEKESEKVSEVEIINKDHAMDLAVVDLIENEEDRKKAKEGVMQMWEDEMEEHRAELQEEYDNETSIDRKKELAREIAEAQQGPQKNFNSGMESTMEPSLSSVSSKYNLAPGEKFEIKSQSIYSSKQPIPVDVENNYDGVIYKVQIGAFSQPIPQNLFKGISPITGERTAKGYIRYTAGIFKSMPSANLIKKEIVALGYRDAFIVAFKNGKRITIKEALSDKSSRDNKDAAAEPSLASVSEEQQQKQNTNPGTESELERSTASAKAPAQEKAGTINSGSLVKAEDLQKRYTDIGVDAFAKNTNVSAPIVSSGSVSSPTAPAASVTPEDVPSGAIADHKDITDMVGLYYTIQVGLFSGPVSPEELNNIQPLFTEPAPGGNLRYSVGIYEDRMRAEEAKTMVHDLGLTDAFVTVYYNGKRISINEAKQIELEGGLSKLTDINANKLPFIQTNNRVANESQAASTNSDNKIYAATYSENDVYKIQVGAFRYEVPVEIVNEFLKIAGFGIENYKDENDLTIFTVGEYKNYEDANEVIQKIKDKGFKDAFIVAYRKGKKVPVSP